MKDIHFIFGKSARSTFVSSKKFDLSTIQLICMEDTLNVGAVCDLDSVEKTEQRRQWLSNIYDHDVSTFVDKDLEVIRSFIETVKKEKIYLWTGHNASEILNTARLLYHLPAHCKDIFVVDFSAVSVKNSMGNIVHPKVLHASEPNQIGEIFNHFYKLKSEELSYFIQLWEKIKGGNSMLRVLDKNGQILEKEETFFDPVLISFCTKEFRPAAKIIGQTLVDIDFNVGDGYLNWRLKELSLAKKVIARGILKNIRDYEVKLIDE